LITIGLTLILIAKIIKKNVEKTKKKYKIQQGKITYSDLNKPAKCLFSNKLKISGKPDYIIKRKDKYIPVEFKTGDYKKPQKNHILQLATYCQLVEDNYKSFVPYGILVYNNKKQYKISYNPQLRFELENTIKQMRSILKTNKIDMNHNSFYRCKNCSMEKYCNIKIK